MNCKIDRTSLTNYVLVVLLAIGVGALVSYFSPEIIALKIEYPIGSWICLVLILGGCAKLILDDNSFNIKGYLVFAGITTLSYVGIMGLMYIVSLRLGFEIEEDDYPVLECSILGVVFATYFHIYFCIIKSTLLKNRKLIKKRLLEEKEHLSNP